MKRKLTIILSTTLLAFLLLVAMGATVQKAEAKRVSTYELWLNYGEHFQVNCNYPNATIQYGSNGEEGVIGVCQ